MTWKEYEEKVFKYFQSRHPDALMTRNAPMSGRLSRTSRDIDILIESQIFGHSIQIAIECKNWKSKLDVADVGSFIDKLKDVGISKGIIVSKVGYSESAYTRARSELEVQLQVLDFDNLPAYSGFIGNPYRGNFGAIISPPNGWIVNTNVPPALRLDLLCHMYPFQFTLKEARVRRQYMYFQIFPVLEGNGLTSAFEAQDAEVKSKDA